MTSLVEKRHAGEFLLAPEDEGHFAFDNVVLAVNQDIQAGQVLGQVNNPSLAAVAAAVAGNTGNGTCSAVTASAAGGAVAGVYRAEFIAATKYNVIDPSGNFVGEGTTGVAFALGGLGFTITAGGTAFVAGDAFTITVTATAGATDTQYKAHDPAATDGSQVASAIAYAEATTDASNTQKIVAVTRNQEVIGDCLVWKTGISAPDKTAGIAALKARGIIVR